MKLFVISMVIAMTCAAPQNFQGQPHRGPRNFNSSPQSSTSNFNSPPQGPSNFNSPPQGPSNFNSPPQVPSNFNSPSQGPSNFNSPPQGPSNFHSSPQSPRGSSNFNRPSNSFNSQHSGFNSPISSYNAPRSTGPAVANKVRNWGPNAYGQGLNNRFAFPVNTFQMERAVALANRQQGVLVRVDVDGDIELTDRFGQEIDEVYDQFGRNLVDTYGL